MQAATTYARALLEAAGSDYERIADELDALATVATDSPDTWEQLTSPRVSTAARVKTLEAAFAKGADQTRNFLRVVAENDHLVELPTIAAAYRELVKEKQNRLDVHVTTAVDLPSELRSRIETQLSKSTGRTVSLHTSVDPAIIGGLVIQHGDLLHDTSLRGRLEQLRLALRRGALPAVNTDES